jgi:ornithine cyclodeaminase
LKLVSVFPENFAKGISSHQGVVVLFDPDSGAPAAIIEAGSLTAIRTAAASAAATDALARPEARSLAVLGYGEQAWRHIAALRQVRPIERVALWGRSPERAEVLAARVRASGLPAEVAADPASAAARADIICTVSAAREPILLSEWVADGTHINAVGSSRAGPCEIDPVLVGRGRFVADHREGVVAQGEEHIRARKAGLIAEDDRPAEIGAVFAGIVPGRSDPREVTIYKSLGSIVQDLAAGDFVWRAVRREA